MELNQIWYTAKILRIYKISSFNEEMNSPKRKEMGLDPIKHGIHIEVEIISVTDTSLNEKVKTSFLTKIGWVSPEDMSYALGSHEGVVRASDNDEFPTHAFKERSAEIKAIKAYSILAYVKKGDLIKFCYPGESDTQRPNETDYFMEYNLIRYNNKPLTMDDFKNKSYPHTIDNIVEDYPVMITIADGSKRWMHYIGLSSLYAYPPKRLFKSVIYKKVPKYRYFLIEIKQKLFYDNNTKLFKYKLALSAIIAVIIIFYTLNPHLLLENDHKWFFILSNIINVLKEFL